MRYLYRLLIFSCLLFTSSAYAAPEIFLDALYWRATETVDWALTNNLTTPNQNITYKTTSFNFKPGFRVGVGYESAWDTKFYYTRYHTNATNSASGNLTSAFLGGKLAQTCFEGALPAPCASYFFQSGNVNFTIDFNMIDWDFSKRFYPTNALMLRPLIGLEGGWINQSVNTSFQNPVTLAENVTNNFSGVGPKVGIETKFTFLRSHDYQFNLIADFTTAYLWGHWNIKDVLNDNQPQTINIEAKNRNFGSLAVHALMGANLDYKCFSMKLGYEINDWFNQCQIFDDGTGAHNNDLILQGITLRLAYNFF